MIAWMLVWRFVGKSSIDGEQFFGEEDQSLEDQQDQQESFDQGKYN
jgi:hypothetical protein